MIKLSNLISDTKTEYYRNVAAKLANSFTRVKTYWSILKTFANGRKVPVIPPILIKNELFSVLRLILMILTDSFSNIVQQFPRIAQYLSLSIVQQMKL